MEPRVHGRGRDPSSENDIHFGVHEEMLYARKLKPIQGAQWTGVVTSIAMEMLASGKVEAVICVHRYPPARATAVGRRSPAEWLVVGGLAVTRRTASNPSRF